MILTSADFIAIDIASSSEMIFNQLINLIQRAPVLGALFNSVTSPIVGPIPCPNGNLRR
jgi:hypothetical protein